MTPRLRPAVLIRRPVRAFVILGLGLSTWAWAFVPFIKLNDPLEVVFLCGVYPAALSGVAIGIVLSVGSRLYWAWACSLAVLNLSIGLMLAIYGVSLELASSGAVQSLLIGISLFLAYTGIVSASGWLTLRTRRAHLSL